ARLDPVHVLDVGDDARAARADALADRPARAQDPAALHKIVALQHLSPVPTFHRLGPGLEDVELPRLAVLAPLDIHGLAVVLLDDERLTCQVLDLRVGEREPQPLGFRHFDGLHRPAGFAIGAINHLDRFLAQATPQDCGPPGGQRRLVDVKLVRIDGALNHGFTQAVSGRDEYDIPETRLRVHREHHARGAKVAAYHLLHANGQGHLGVLEALMDA